MIYFIRHGECEANVRHVFAGQKDDSLLTEIGKEQAQVAGQTIKENGLAFNRIISSPLIRTRETANIIAAAINYDKDIEIDPRINEYDMGALTGKPTFEISSRMFAQTENAEGPQEFYNRVESFLKEWSKSDENILMVAHAGVGRIIQTIQKGTDPALFYDLPPYPNAELIKLDWLK